MVLLLSKKPRGQCSNAPQALLYSNLLHSIITFEVKTCLGCCQTTSRGKVGQNRFSTGLTFALWQKRETHLQWLICNLHLSNLSLSLMPTGNQNQICENMSLRYPETASPCQVTDRSYREGLFLNQLLGWQTNDCILIYSAPVVQVCTTTWIVTDSM